MKAKEIKEFLDNCGLDPNEKLTTHNDSWWVLKDLIGHAFEVSAQKTFESLYKEPGKEEEKWISVEKEMPKTGVPVIAYGINENGKSRRLKAYFAPKFSIDADCFEGDADYCEEKDEYFLPEGWYEQNEYEDINWYVGLKITHWQPLPTPPKQ